MQQSTTEVYRSEGLLTITQRESARGVILMAHRSKVLVRTDGRMYQRVTSLLDEGCYSEGLVMEATDDLMPRGQAVQETYKVWYSCPGPEVDHRCKIGNEKEWSEDGVHIMVAS